MERRQVRVEAVQGESSDFPRTENIVCVCCAATQGTANYNTAKKLKFPKIFWMMRRGYHVCGCAEQPIEALTRAHVFAGPLDENRAAETRQYRRAPKKMIRIGTVGRSINDATHPEYRCMASQCTEQKRISHVGFAVCSLPPS